MTSFLSKRLIILGLMFAFSLSTPLMAAEDDDEVVEEGEEETKEPIQYYAIEPNILTFYQGTGKKIGYVVVQVNIAVRGQENYDLLDLHKPLIQDNLIDFFNKKDKSVIQPIQARQQLLKEAKQSVSAVLKKETGKDIIENLLFTNYVYQ